MANEYKTPRAFKAAFEARLKDRAKKLGRNMARERQLAIFSRFLSRLNMHYEDRVVLKGGFAMEVPHTSSPSNFLEGALRRDCSNR